MSIYSLCRKLSSVKRFSRDFSIHNESVLEHTGFSALWCLSVAAEARQAGYFVDTDLLLHRVLLHDIEESEIGDINRKAKYATETIREGFKELEHRVARQIFADCFGGVPIRIWSDAKDETLEGQIVAASDFAAVAYHLSNEVFNLGNRNLIRTQKECEDILREKIAECKFPFVKAQLEKIMRVLTGVLPT